MGSTDQLGKTPMLYIAKPPLGSTPSNNVRTAVEETIENVGNFSGLGGEILNKGLPWHSEWTKYIIDAFPEVYYKNSMKRHGPLLAFTKNDAYHKWGRYYNRVDIRNIGDSLPDFLSKTAYICQLLLLKSKIEEYRNADLSWPRFLEFSAEITTFFTSTADIFASMFPNIAETVGYVAAEGTATTLGGGMTLSAVGQMIGAFLLGMALGKIVGNIPCGNGKIVQDYIDQHIQEIWEHPYKTIGLCPGGMVFASGVVALKKAIEININMVSNIKPLTEVEKRKLELYKMQHREMYIIAKPSLSIRALK